MYAKSDKVEHYINQEIDHNSMPFFENEVETIIDLFDPNGLYASAK